jgi:hypothetical protein
LPAASYRKFRQKQRGKRGDHVERGAAHKATATTKP